MTRTLLSDWRYGATRFPNYPSGATGRMTFQRSFTAIRTFITTGCNWCGGWASWGLFPFLSLRLPASDTRRLSWRLPSLARLGFRSKCRSAASWLLLCAGLLWGINLLYAEHLLAQGWATRSMAFMRAAAQRYPHLRYIAQGPARLGDIREIERYVRKDPRAYDLVRVLQIYKSQRRTQP